MFESVIFLLIYGLRRSPGVGWARVVSAFVPLRALASGGPLRGCLTVTINWPRTYASANMPHKMVTIHNAPAPRAIKPNESGRLPVGVMRFLQLRTPG